MEQDVLLIKETFHLTKEAYHLTKESILLLRRNRESLPLVAAMKLHKGMRLPPNIPAHKGGADFFAMMHFPSFNAFLPASATRSLFFYHQPNTFYLPAVH
jgi:hypothetical protein